MMADNDLHKSKLVLVGEAGVGKSSIAGRFARGCFDDFQESTIGAAFLAHKVIRNDGRIIKFDVWDTAGQERYHSLAPMYYRGAKAAVVVYDITNIASFMRAKIWIQELKQCGSNDLVICLVGNKLDLATKRVIPYDVMKEFSESHGLVPMEVSARSGENVSKVFSTLANMIEISARTQNKQIQAELMEKKRGCCM